MGCEESSTISPVNHRILDSSPQDPPQLVHRNSMEQKNQKEEDKGAKHGELNAVKQKEKEPQNLTKSKNIVKEQNKGQQIHQDHEQEQVILISDSKHQTSWKVDIEENQNNQIKLNISKPQELSYKVEEKFNVLNGKMLEGKSSTERNYSANDLDNPLIKQDDCFEKIGIMSLFDGYFCHTVGEYNYNSWFIQKGSIYGIEAYRVFPPKLKPRISFGSHHCLLFFISEKRNYNIYKIEEKKLTQVSWISSVKVQSQKWNIISNVLISEITSPMIYFICDSDTKLPKELAPKANSSYDKSTFIPTSQKLLTGFFSRKFQKEIPISPIIKQGDCFDNFGIFSLPAEDNSYCHVTGHYNYNNWIVEKGTLAGIDAYRVHPPKSKPKNGLISNHCVIFKIDQKQDYNFFTVENSSLLIASFLEKQVIKVNHWNVVTNLCISQISDPIIYFSYPANKKLPSQLQTKQKQGSYQVRFQKYCQKLLSGKFSVEHEDRVSSSPHINPSDCLINFGIMSLFNGYFCQTSGEYNCTNWVVQKGNLLGIEAYRLHPPQKAKIQFLTNHCILFFVHEKKNYNIFKIEDQKLTQVSWISSLQVKPQDWNIISNILISQIASPVIYFILDSEIKLPKELAPQAKSIYDQLSFIPSSQKLMTGLFSKKFQKEIPISPIIKQADCYDSFGIVSLPGEDNAYCHVTGDHNYNNWIVEKGTLAGIDAYRVHPPKLKPKKSLLSNHCITFKIQKKQDYNFFIVSNGTLLLASFLQAKEIEMNGWNFVTNLTISQISAPIIYFAYPSNSKLPSLLQPTENENKSKLRFQKYCQKLLSGKFSLQHEDRVSSSPHINPSDCLINFGIMSLFDGYYCQTSGDYNYTNWVVEKGKLSGLQAYRVHPPQLKPKISFATFHCIVFFVTEKKNYNIYKIENQEIILVSWLQASKVKAQDWNIVFNVPISQITSPVIYLICHSDAKLPKELVVKALPQSNKIPFKPKYQKLLTGLFSKKIHEDIKISPIIKQADCMDIFGIASLPMEETSFCHVRGDYNQNNWYVQKGNLSQMDAYRIHPSKLKPKLGSNASNHCVCFYLKEKEHFCVYRIKQNGTFTQVGSIRAQEVRQGQFHLFQNIMVTEIQSPVTFILSKTSLKNNQLKSVLKQEYKQYIVELQLHKNLFMPSSKSASSLPLVHMWDFKKQDQKLLTGKFSKQCPGRDVPAPFILSGDCFYSIGFLSVGNDGHSHVTGKFNCNNWVVEKGEAEGMSAFRVHPPENLPKQRILSDHCLIIKLQNKEDYDIFQIYEGIMRRIRHIPASEVNPGKYTILKTISVSKLRIPTIFVIQKSANKRSSYKPLSKNVQGATIYQNEGLSIEHIQFEVPENPHTPFMFQYGPSSHQNCYICNRRFWRIENKNRQIIVWSNSDDSVITMTYFYYADSSLKNIRLECKKGFILAAATGCQNYLYYVIVQPEQNPNKSGTMSMFLIKADINTGKIIKEVQLATDSKTLDLNRFQNGNIAVSGNLVTFLLTRTQTQAQYGINHQSACLAVFNIESLQMVCLKRIASHSFGNTLMRKNDGRFCGIDQGDNGPRGINFWIFDDKNFQSKVLYTYKTHHGKTQRNSSGVLYPEYSQISTQKTKFYKWSNDNSTYAEIGAPGLLEAQDGFYVVFAGQNQPNPLDSSTTDGSFRISSRNLGYVKIIKEFCEDLKQFILSEGPVFQSAFYDYHGNYRKQVNKGVKWLTKLTGEQNVSRLKTGLFGDKLLMVYEVWSKFNYLRTEFIILTVTTGKFTEPKKLPSIMRLHRTDDMFMTAGGKSAVILSGDYEKCINRYEFRII